MKDYQKMYEEKLKAQKEKVLGSAINDTLELKSISNKQLDKIRAEMSTVVPGNKQVWDDFNFRTGRIFGILRFIAQNPKHRQQLLEVTGLTNDHIDIYFNVCGNLPYINTTNNTVNEGRPMDVEATKEFITAIGLKFGVVIEEVDLSDITQERWDKLYNAAIDKMVETVKHNEEYADTVPTQYDE